MKKYLISFVFIFLLSSAAYSADVRPYVGVKGGVSFIESDFDLGYYHGYHNHSYNNGHYYYNNCHYHEHYDDSSASVFAGAAALGVKVKDFLRFEFEYTYRTEAGQSYRWFPDIDQELNTYMVNAFYDFAVTPVFVPYAGIGFGVTHIENTVKYNSGYKETISKDRFSVGVDFGISFAFVNHLNLDCGIKAVYLGTMEIEYEDYYTYALDLYVGLRYTI